jgi:hypothetical protein
MDEAKAFVSRALAADVGEPPASVTCPELVKLKAQETFQCTADYGGGAVATVVVRQQDDQGNVTVESVSGILVANKAEAAIARGLGEQLNVHATVDCGPRVRPAAAGAVFTCAASDAKGARATVEVSVKDASGNVSWRVVPTP